MPRRTLSRLATRTAAILLTAGCSVAALAGCSAAATNLPLQQVLGSNAPTIAPSGDAPAGYPSVAVPLLTGPITTSAATTVNGKRVWTVDVHAPDAFSRAQGRLLDAGFEIGAMASANGTGVAHLTAKTYAVTLTGGAKSVLYVVQQR